MNKNDILTKVSAFANGEATLPTGDEYTQWNEFLATADKEWNQAYDFQGMIKIYRTTLAQSETSISLPSDFKEKFAGYIEIGGDKYPEYSIIESTITSGDYVTWGGNQNSGYYMNLSMPRSEHSSVVVAYHSRVTSLSTGTSISQSR